MKKLQDHLQLEVFPDRSDYFQNGFKLGFGVWGERFVMAWPAETCLFSDAGHSYRLSHMAKHNYDFLGIPFFEYGIQVFLNHFLIIEVLGNVKFCGIHVSFLCIDSRVPLLF